MYYRILSFYAFHKTGGGLQYMYTSVAFCGFFRIEMDGRWHWIPLVNIRCLKSAAHTLSDPVSQGARGGIGSRCWSSTLSDNLESQLSPWVTRKISPQQPWSWSRIHISRTWRKHYGDWKSKENNLHRTRKGVLQKVLHGGWAQDVIKLKNLIKWWYDPKNVGQKLEDKHVEALAAIPPDAPFLDKVLLRHRRAVGNMLTLKYELIWYLY